MLLQVKVLHEKCYSSKYSLVKALLCLLTDIYWNHINKIVILQYKQRVSILIVKDRLSIYSETKLNSIMLILQADWTLAFLLEAKKLWYPW